MQALKVTHQRPPMGEFSPTEVASETESARILHSDTLNGHNEEAIGFWQPVVEITVRF